MTSLRCLSGLMLAAILGFASPSPAQNLGVMLSPEQFQALPQDARPFYQRALEHADRIDYQGAVDEMAHAAELAPNNIEIQFLVEKCARYLAEISYDEVSLKNFDYAETALRRLLANSTLGPEERARALRESQKISESKNGLRARDEQRLKDGLDLVMSIHDRRLESSSGSNEGAQKLLEQSRERTQKQQDEESIYPWMRITGELGSGSGGGGVAAAGAALAAGAGVPDPFATGGGEAAVDTSGGFGDAGGGFDPFANPAPIARPAAAAQPARQPAAPVVPAGRRAHVPNEMEPW